MIGSDAEFLKDSLLGIQMIEVSLSALDPDALYKGTKNLPQKKKGFGKRYSCLRDVNKIKNREIITHVEII